MYRFSEQFNNLYFFEERADVKRCPVCKELLAKWDEDLTVKNLVVPIHRRKKKYDMSSSYDGVSIVSHRFKDVYEHSGMTGLQFTDLSDGAFAIFSPNIVAFDTQRGAVRFEKLCPVCGRYKDVTIGGPISLLPGNVVPLMGFAQTDIEFASNDEKHPILLCGDEVAKILWAAKLKGVVLVKVKT